MIFKNLSMTQAVAGLVFTLCLGLFILMAYGGIRTADGEIVFRTGEALATRGSLALTEDLAAWPGFAVARGVDGRIYSVFAPGQSLVLAPIVRLAQTLNQTRWIENRGWEVPVSFTVDGNSLRDYLLDRTPLQTGPHTLRFLVSFFIPLITALVVVVYFFVIRRLTASLPAALIAALLLALATPLWSYAGMMFKEPLTLLWVLLSFYRLIGGEVSPTDQEKNGRLFLPGLLLGLAFLTHIRAVLFVPFFLVYGVRSWNGDGAGGWWSRRRLAAALSFMAGFSIPAAVFGWLNYVRFGHVLETGRLISSVTYGAFVPPWEGLGGLLVSPGKGLFWFCPLVVLGLASWPRLHRVNPRLSLMLAGAIVLHWVFLACRSDWHGGFCLGPRYLLPILPFLLIPVAVVLSGWSFSAPPTRPDRFRRRLLVLFFTGCVVQQVYFCLGEPVSFYYLLKQYGLERGVSIISDNSIYFNWRTSPLFFLLQANRGPFLLQNLPLNNYALWALAGATMALIIRLVFRLADFLHRQTAKNTGCL